MRNFLKWILWGSISLASLVIFGVLFSGIASTFMGERADRPSAEQLAGMAPSSLSPHGELSQAFSLFSSMTSAQQDAFEEKLIGQVVSWSLPASDVQVRKSAIQIRTSTTLAGTISTNCVIQDPTDADVARAEALAIGDRFTCKGLIKKRTWNGGLEINPAIVIWN